MFLHNVRATIIRLRCGMHQLRKLGQYVCLKLRLWLLRLFHKFPKSMIYLRMEILSWCIMLSDRLLTACITSIYIHLFAQVHTLSLSNFVISQSRPIRSLGVNLLNQFTQILFRSTKLSL